MKKTNLKNDLFKKFEKNQAENLNLVFGGRVLALLTDQSSDKSDSQADCTGDNCDSSDWAIDSTSQTDSARDVD